VKRPVALLVVAVGLAASVACAAPPAPPALPAGQTRTTESHLLTNDVGWFLLPSGSVIATRNDGLVDVVSSNTMAPECDVFRTPGTPACVRAGVRGKLLPN
jgi:hypothetical protein